MEGDLTGPILQMPVDALFGNVEFSIWEPLIEMKVIDPEHGFGESVPVDVLGLMFPVVDWVLD